MKFSVVVPLYNKSYSIVRCIDSILSQSYGCFEIIVVNDGSTDDSVEILKSWYSDRIKNGQIRLIEQENEGVSAARNKGAQIASHDCVCFLDADDEWMPEFLERMKQLIADFPLADLYCLAHKVCKFGRKSFVPRHGLPFGYRGYIEDFFDASARGSVANSSKVCVRSDALMKIGGFPVGVVAGEDLYVWIRLALNGLVACYMFPSVVVRVSEDDSRSARRNSVPYPFIYLSSNKLKPKGWSFNKYLFVIFYTHFLWSIASLKFREAWLRAFAYLRVYF